MELNYIFEEEERGGVQLDYLLEEELERGAGVAFIGLEITLLSE